MTDTITRVGRALLALAVVLGVASGRTADAEPAEEKAEALAIAERMATFLAQAPRFSFVLESSYDVVQADGRELEFGATRRVAVRRPDRLRVDEVRRDGGRRGQVFDGREIRAFDLDANVYAVDPRQGTLKEVIDYMVDDLGMRFPLNEMITGELVEGLASARGALLVGEERIGDATCDHVAARGFGVDLQLWVQQGNEPLLRRAVVTYTEAAGRPQFRADLSDWNLDPELPESVFAFAPPDGAERIPFAAAARAAGAGSP